MGKFESFFTNAHNGADIICIAARNKSLKLVEESESLSKKQHAKGRITLEPFLMFTGSLFLVAEANINLGLSMVYHALAIECKKHNL